MASTKDQRPRPDGEIRRSQIVTTFGPGALVDLPEHSGIVAGLEHWGNPDKPGSGFREVPEPRLLAKLAGQGIEKLYTPPTLPSNEEGQAGIVVWELPRWFLVQPLAPEERWDSDRAVRSRRMIHRDALRGSTFGKSRVVPVRFVQACPYGHLSDVDWGTFAHRGASECRSNLFMDERGTTGDFADIFVRCACGASRSLAEAIPRNPSDMPLGECRGAEPWLGPDRWLGKEGACPPADSSETGKPKKVGNRLLVRSATNAYFPELATVISIPEAKGASSLDAAVASVWGDGIAEVTDAGDVRSAKKYNPKIRDALGSFPDAEIAIAVQKKKAAVPAAATGAEGLKVAELEKLLGEDLGEDKPESDFFATEVTLPSPRPGVLRCVRRVLAVHRLREVVALRGFTRLEPPARDAEGSLDLGVRRARLATDARWLPAVENRGEGMFIAFDSAAIDRWSRENERVRKRKAQLEAGVLAWKVSHPGVALSFPGVAYVMLHTLAHLLITAVSLECGYAASSIRERIYACPEGYGILLYTASPDAEGTLGGLAAAARKLTRHLQAALSYGALCSNDPVCAQHEPDSAVEERFFHGAACHGCLLLAEPCCEWRNEFLDRALVVPTVAPLGAELFTEERLEASR